MLNGQSQNRPAVLKLPACELIRQGNIIYCRLGKHKSL